MQPHRAGVCVVDPADNRGAPWKRGAKCLPGACQKPGYHIAESPMPQLGGSQPEALWVGRRLCGWVATEAPLWADGRAVYSRSNPTLHRALLLASLTLAPVASGTLSPSGTDSFLLYSSSILCCCCAAACLQCLHVCCCLGQLWSSLRGREPQFSVIPTVVGAHTHSRGCRPYSAHLIFVVVVVLTSS